VVMVDDFRSVTPKSIAQVHLPRVLRAARNKTAMMALRRFLSVSHWRSELRRFRPLDASRFIYKLEDG
jgi:hypothetical protein